MHILGVANSYASAPVNAPTSLSGVPSTTSVAISFTAPTNDGGAAITNYEYSFNNSTWTAFSPADAASPVTVSGLTANTSYSIYLRAVNIVGSGPGSTGLSVTTLPVFMVATGGTQTTYSSGGFTYRSHTFTGSGTFTVSTVGSFGTVDAVVVAGGGGGGQDRGGGGGAGGMQTTSPTLSATGYSVSVGGGGGTNGGNGGNSSFNGVTSSGGGYAGFCCYANPNSGGSGGGCSANGGCTGGSGIGGQGNNGGNTDGQGWMGSGGGGKGAAGVAASGSGPAAGGNNAYRTGSNEMYSYGGQGKGGAPFDGTDHYTVGAYGSGGAGNNAGGQNGYQGVVIIRYRIA